MRQVYHVSETPGIREFVPRKFWHIDYCVSGPVRDGSHIPADAEIVTCFYASSEEYAPFYYPPKGCRRLFVWRRKNPESFDELARLFGPVTSDRVMIFDERVRSSLETHEFSIYAFACSEFETLPNGEFVARHTVVPVGEVRRKDVLQHLFRDGYQVIFVECLARAQRMIQEIGLRADSEGV